MMQQNQRKTTLGFHHKEKYTPNFDYHFKQSTQSIKNLTLYLKSYKKQSQRIKNTQDDQLPPPQQQATIKNHKKVFPEDYDAKCHALISQICQNMEIFRKLFKSNRKKKSIISQLYGWDEQFSQVFFNGDQLKPNINQNIIYRNLGMDKRTYKAKNIYNKLRLFLQELIKYNLQHQQESSTLQKKRFSQSLTKLHNDFSSIKVGKFQTAKYLQTMKKIQTEIVNRKLRIKNKTQDIISLQKTGTIKINPFFYHQQKNINMIQEVFKLKI